MDPSAFEDGTMSQSLAEMRSDDPAAAAAPSITGSHPQHQQQSAAPHRNSSAFLSGSYRAIGTELLGGQPCNSTASLSVPAEGQRRFRRVSDNSLVIVAEQNSNTTAPPTQQQQQAPAKTATTTRRLSAAAVPSSQNNSVFPWSMSWAAKGGADQSNVSGESDEDAQLVWGGVVRSSDLVHTSLPGVRSPLSTIGGNTMSAPTSNRTIDRLLQNLPTAKLTPSEGRLQHPSSPLSSSNRRRSVLHDSTVVPEEEGEEDDDPSSSMPATKDFAKDFQDLISFTPMRMALRIRTQSLQTPILSGGGTPSGVSPLLSQFTSVGTGFGDSDGGPGQHRKRTIFFATVPSENNAASVSNPLMPSSRTGGGSSPQQAPTSPPPPSYVLVDTTRDLICGVLTGFHDFCLVEEVWLKAHQYYMWCTTILLVFSLWMLCLGTVASIRRSHDTLFLVVEAVFCGWLIVDYMTRLITIRSSRLWFVVNVWTLIDLLSVVPFLIDACSGLRTDVRGLGTFRIFRIVGLVQELASANATSNLKAFTVMIRRAIVKSGVLSLLPVLIGLFVFVAATAVWLGEQSTSTLYNPAEDGPVVRVDRPMWVRDDGSISPYQSIYHTMWIAIVTMFTIGYGGDLVPISPAGRALCSMIMIGGVITIAFPTVILSAAFHDAYNTRFLLAVQERLQRKQKQAIELCRTSRRVRLVKERLRALSTSKSTLSKLRLLQNANNNPTAPPTTTICVTGGGPSPGPGLSDSASVMTPDSLRPAPPQSNGPSTSSCGDPLAATEKAASNTISSVGPLPSTDLNTKNTPAKIASKYAPNDVVKTRLTFRSFLADDPKDAFDPDVLAIYKPNAAVDLECSSPLGSSAALAKANAQRSERYWLRHLLQSGSMPAAVVCAKSLNSFRKKRTITHHEGPTTPRNGKRNSKNGKNGAAAGGGGAAVGWDRIQMLAEEEAFFSDDSFDDPDQTAPLPMDSDEPEEVFTPRHHDRRGANPAGVENREVYLAQRRGLRVLDNHNNNVLQLRAQLIDDGVVTYPPKLKLLCVGGTNVIRCIVDRCFPPGSISLSLTLVLDDAMYHESQLAIAKAMYGTAAVERAEVAPISKLRVQLQLCRSAMRRAIWARGKATAASSAASSNNFSTAPLQKENTTVPDLADTSRSRGGNSNGTTVDLSYVSTFTTQGDDEVKSINDEDSSSKDRSSNVSTPRNYDGGPLLQQQQQHRPSLFFADDASLLKEIITPEEQKLLDSCFLVTSTFHDVTATSSLTLTVMCPEMEAYQAFEKHFSLLKFTFGVEFFPPQECEVPMIEAACARANMKTAALLDPSRCLFSK